MARVRHRGSATDTRSQKHARSRLVLGLSLGLSLVVVGLYGQTLRFGFVNLDDHVYVVDNAMVQRGLSGDGLRWACTTYHTGNWHPLTWLSLMTDTSLFGPNAAGHHAVNALLHAANAALLFLVLQRMTGTVWRSAFVAALFAVHPLRAESVAWISERKDVLAGLFWPLTMLVYQWYARRPRIGGYLAVVSVFTIGLTAKPMLVTLPVILLLGDVWPLQRYRRWSWWRLAAEKIPFLVIVAAVSWLTVAAQRFGLSLQDTSLLPIADRVANALVAYVIYLSKTLWPNDLTAFYPHPGFLHQPLADAEIGRALVAAAILIVITAALLRRARTIPALAFGWLWYLATLVPVIGLVQVGEQAFADRYTYIPSIGLYIIIAWGLAAVVAVRPRLQRVVASACGATLCVLSVVAWFQIGTWRDSITLFRHAVAVTSDNYFAHANLGNLLRNEGRLDDAAGEFDRALAIKPDFSFARIGYGALLEQHTPTRRKAWPKHSSGSGRRERRRPHGAVTNSTVRTRVATGRGANLLARA